MNYYSRELYHHGIKGMKWGVRLYQNPDGTLTAAGKERYGTVSRLQQNRPKSQAEMTYDRIRSIRKDKARMARMNARQKESLDRSEKYWKERVEGKEPTQKRNIVKRQADWYRSHDKKRRVVANVSTNYALRTGAYFAAAIILKSRTGRLMTVPSTAKIATQAILATIGEVAVQELVFSKAAGHY